MVLYRTGGRGGEMEKGGSWSERDGKSGTCECCELHNIISLPGRRDKQDTAKEEMVRKKIRQGQRAALTRVRLSNGGDL